MHLRIPGDRLNPGQRALLDSTAWGVLVSGGFGSGKTTALAIKTLLMAALNPGAPGLLLAPNWRTMWSTTYARLRKMMVATFPKGGLPKVVDRQTECYLRFPNGSTVYLRSAKNVDSYDGLDVAWVGGDEVRHWAKKSYEVAIGRVRVKCPYPQRFFVSTPAMGWMDTEFNSGLANRELIVAPTFENAAHLQDDYIENLRLSYSARLQAAVLEGIFTILEGAVYEAFDPRPSSPSIIDYDARANAGRKTMLMVDPGYRRSSYIWARDLGKPGEPKWVAFHQLQPENMPVRQAVIAVNDINEQRKWALDEVWVDPAADAKDQIEGQTIVSALAQLNFRGGKRPRIGRPWSDSYRAIDWGVEKVRTMLGDDSTDRPRRLYFSRELADRERGQPRGIIKSLSSYAYPEVKEGRPVTDIPVKDGVYDHACDALRYWTVGMWLTNPILRKLDSQISTRDAGYRMAS